MLSSLAEGLIQRLCGRYLKNFSSDNVSVSVGGTISLKNVQLKVEELVTFQLPFKPALGFIGSLHADLPIVIGGNFNIRISDVLIVLERNSEDVMKDPAIVHKALQMWIGAFYFSFAQLESVKDGISSSDIEYGLRLFDRLVVSISNVHFRVEDVYTAHIPPPIGRELLCLGLIIGQLEFRSPNTQEMANDDGNVWQPASSSKVVQINKLYQAQNIQLYCARENGLASTADHELCIEFVRKVSYMRKVGNIIGPSEAIMKGSLAYHRTNQVFGPINIIINGKNFDVHINDEQTAYISDFSQAFDHHLHKVQLNSKLDHCRSAEDKSVRAKMRWALLRDSMKVDWNKYVNTLEGGSIRWRTWFNTWRLAAKYVALREILLYHVGFEAVLDKNGETVSYSISESLFADHYRENKLNSKSNDSSPTQLVNPVRKNGRYRGFGLFSPSQLQTAQTLVRKQIENNCERSAFNDNVDPLSLAGSVIRALYAMQLDLDTLLPIKVSAICRIWAEDKYRMKKAREAVLPSPPVIENESNEEIETNVGMDIKTKVLLLAVVDAVNLRGTFGVRNLDAYCTITPQCGEKKSAPIVTESSNVKIHKSGTGFATWGEVYSLPVDSTSDDINNQYIIECNTRGYFTPSYGRLVIPKSHFLKQASVVADTFNESDIQTSHCTLDIASSGGGLFGSSGTVDYSKYLTDIALTSPDPELVSVRLMTMVVEGTDRFQSAVQARFSARVKEAIAERTLVVQRQQELAAREAMRNDDDDDVEEVFILDPSALTIHDLNFSIKFDRLSVTVEMLYLTPAPLRAQISKISSKELPHFKSIPLAYILIKGFEANAQGSNNPWVITAKLSVQKVKIQEIYNSQVLLKSNEKRRECFSLKIPPIHAQLNVTQTSTMSRTIGASLDESCFDFDGFVEMHPFKVKLNPRSFFVASGCKSVTLWKMYRILQHLWTRQSEWALGYGFNSMGEGSTFPKQSPEASLRLGNPYTAKPKHINVISEYLASIRHADDNYFDDSSDERFKLLPPQVSVLTMVTETRTMDISVNCRTDSDSLWYNENHLENSDDDSSDDDDDEEVLVNASKSSGYLDWMAPVGNIVGLAGGVVGLGGKDEIEKQRLKAQKRSNRQNEKKLMIARIKELEEKIAILEKR